MNKIFDIDYTCGECLVKSNCNERCDTYKKELEEAYEQFDYNTHSSIINHVLLKHDCPLCHNNTCQVDKSFTSNQEGESWRISITAMCNDCNLVLATDLYYLEYENYVNLIHFLDNDSICNHTVITFKELSTLYSIFDIQLNSKHLTKEFSKEFICGLNSNKYNVDEVYDR